MFSPCGRSDGSLTAIKEVNPITAAKLSSGCITSKLGVKRDGRDEAGGAHTWGGGGSSSSSSARAGSGRLGESRSRVGLCMHQVFSKVKCSSSQRASITALFNLSQSNYQRVSLTRGGEGGAQRLERAGV